MKKNILRKTLLLFVFAFVTNSLYVNGVAQSTNGDDGYVKEFWIYNVAPDFQQQYAAVKEQIAYVKSQMDPQMTDLDKLLWIHDYIDDITVYKNDVTLYVHSPVGPLYYGNSVCDGYAHAMELLLEQVGIESVHVSNNGHGWTAVRIDGELYHVDPTWNDTRRNATGVSGRHYFLMRNDYEFTNDANHPHTGFYYMIGMNQKETTISTSTKYTDWYVHDVKGNMLYHDGYWYYVQNNKIMKNNIQGTDGSEVIAGSGLAVVSIEDGVLTYTENSVSKTVSLSEIEDETEDRNEDETGTGTEDETETGIGGRTEDETETGTGLTGGQTGENDSQTGGETVQQDKIQATINPGKKYASTSLFWKSSNEKIATVTQSGVVKGLKKEK